jgi:hypothetical protein
MRSGVSFLLILTMGFWASTVLAQTTAKEYRMKEEARRSQEERRRKKKKKEQARKEGRVKKDDAAHRRGRVHFGTGNTALNQAPRG